jgi:erythromycin esterase-like protein
MKLSIHVLLVLLFGVAPSAKAFVPLEFGDGAALTAVTRDLCQRPVVMIGESATHGDGATEAFKVALVEKLVNECGFDSVYFEASHYEFINIARKLRESKAVSVEDVSAAIGGLWKFDEEFQPLVPFLLEKAVAGKISLGGIDDQLGEMGQDWANVAMVANLTMVLPESQGKECGLALHRRIYGEDADSSADRAEVTGCLSDARRIYAGDKANDRRDDDDWVEMIGAFQRWIDRDPAAEAEQIVARDRSMFQNFEWLRRQEPRRHKVIVWAATVHIAKQGDPTWGDRTGTNFGSLVHREYGAKAFSLGFSALMGTYRQGHGAVRDQPMAPADSLEAQAFREGGAAAVYVGPAQLEAMGTVLGAVFQHSYQVLPWSNYVDGVVVFRREHPPTSARGR